MPETPPPPAAPRVIRRYPNRKLYDVQQSTYVALEDLAELVRAGETVQVVDSVSGEDLTAQTLTQVILDEGKRGPSLLPTELLHAALRRGGRALDAGRGAVGGALGGAVDQLRHGVDDLFQHGLGRLSRVLPAARADELDALKRQLADVERTLAALVGQQQHPQSPRPQSHAPAPADPAVDVASLPSQEPRP